MAGSDASLEGIDLIKEVIKKYNATNPIAKVVVTHGYSRDNIGFGWTNGVFMEFYNIEHGIH